MTDVLKTISPVDGSLYVERALAGEGEIDRRLASATAAQPGWKGLAIADRVALLRSPDMVERLHAIWSGKTEIDLAWSEPDESLMALELAVRGVDVRAGVNSWRRSHRTAATRRSTATATSS